MRAKRYYKPSKEEVKLGIKILEQLIQICERDASINIKDACINFSCKEGSYYEYLREGKELTANVKNFKNQKADIQILVEKGLLIYYKFNNKTTYVAKLKEIANSKNIKAGKYVEEYVETEYEQKRKLEKNTPNSWDESKKDKTPKIEYNNIPKKENPQPLDDGYDEWMDWYERHEYCEQYRQMFGTESTEVTDEY